VLKQLIDCGYITQLEGTEDRRQRHLYPTTAGRELALDLARPQSRRIGRAFARAGTGLREDVVKFLSGMSNKGSEQ
jgi:DNA-binding MarR family transcriptional regulator